MSEAGFPVEKLNRRLMTAAEFVRPGAVVADIGTDHAYLPVFLISRGIALRAVAADINRGPLERAKRNISAAGLDGIITTRLADGLSELESLGITDITVCGMGGELMARIIENAEWVRDKSIRLILQPMTKAETLRGYLLSHGFGITGEKLAEDDRIYQIICAEYSGSSDSTYSDTELLLGRFNIKRNDELFRRFAVHVLETFNTRRDGKSLSGGDVSYENGIIEEIKKLTGF